MAFDVWKELLQDVKFVAHDSQIDFRQHVQQVE